MFENYDHPKGKYLGCFCKDETSKLQKEILPTVSMHNRLLFALINVGSEHSNREHWMGLVINRSTNHAGYFDSFGRHSTWLIEAMENLFPQKFHHTKYKVQSESTSPCSLHIHHSPFV